MKNLCRACVSAALLAMASVGVPQAARDASLRPLAFLSGRWVSDKPNDFEEESWSPVSGDSMTGSFRVVQGGKAVFYEFWAVEIDNDRPVLKLKHFNAGLKGWEEKADSTAMPLVSASEGDAVFAEADGSVSLHYHRSGNTLTCTVHHVKEGKGSDELFELTRVGSS